MIVIGICDLNTIEQGMSFCEISVYAARCKGNSFCADYDESIQF